MLFRLDLHLLGAQWESTLEALAGVDDSAAARLAVSTGHHGWSRLPARNRSLHTRTSALKARSGVLIGQPSDNGLVALYSAIQLDSDGGLGGFGSLDRGADGRLRRSSPSLGEGGMGGEPQSGLKPGFLGSQMVLAISFIASPT